jgi:hypothetical protein
LARPKAETLGVDEKHLKVELGRRSTGKVLGANWKYFDAAVDLEGAVRTCVILRNLEIVLLKIEKDCGRIADILSRLQREAFPEGMLGNLVQGSLRASGRTRSSDSDESMRGEELPTPKERMKTVTWVGSREYQVPRATSVVNTDLLYAPGCTSLKQPRIQGRAGSQATVSGTGEKVSMPAMFEAAQYLST